MFTKFPFAQKPLPNKQNVHSLLDMANAVFASKVSPAYDDLPEVRYHFPSTYLNQVKQAEGDWIIYYEPRRKSSDLSSHGGRQCYFAIARVARVAPDPARHDHYYAYMSDYLEFPNDVPFREGSNYFEAKLQKGDGSTNKGRFGRSVRIISQQEFQNICRVGLADSDPEKKPESDFQFNEPPPKFDTQRRTRITERPVRDAAFTRVIQEAYNNTCAMTGLKIINGGGRCEIEAAHIVAVEDNGPDSPRNGIALSRTIHWMFDRHFLSISDAGEIMVAKKRVPDPILRLLNPDRRVKLPRSITLHPHPAFLQRHRELFKGD
jgi:putative restriction endonuclease